MPGFLKFCLKALRGMVRVADMWEVVLLCSFPVFLGIVLFQGRLGIPRVIAGLLLVVLLVQAIACIIVLDNLYSRQEQFRR